MALTPMPSLRRSIKADVSKNKSLKDILPSTADNPGRIKRAILNVLPVVSGLAPGNPGRNNDLYLRAIDFARIESGKFILNERDEGIAVKSCGVREYEGR